MSQPRNIFSLHDPSGAIVHLTQRVWNEHTLARHGRMRSYLADLKATLSNPQRMYDDTEYSEVVTAYFTAATPGEQYRVYTDD